MPNSWNLPACQWCFHECSHQIIAEHWRRKYQCIGSGIAWEKLQRETFCWSGWVLLTEYKPTKAKATNASSILSSSQPMPPNCLTVPKTLSNSKCDDDDGCPDQLCGVWLASACYAPQRRLSNLTQHYPPLPLLLLLLFLLHPFPLLILIFFEVILTPRHSLLPFLPLPCFKLRPPLEF